MKVCYFDESGTGEEPVAVVTGVVVDAQRMHATKEHWSELLDVLSGLCGRKLDELHTKDFYAGNSPFKKMDGPTRAKYISEIISWFCERKHDFVYSAVHKAEYEKSRAAGKLHAELSTPWIAGAFHCVLALQRAHQCEKKTRGHTLLIFDNKGHDEGPLTNLVVNPPQWSNTYYGRGNRDAALSHMVDAPYFADSKQVPMIQVADFLAYFLRRYVEIAENLVPPKYEEEEPRIRSGSGRYPSGALGSTTFTRQRDDAKLQRCSMHTVRSHCAALRANQTLHRTAARRGRIVRVMTCARAGAELRICLAAEINRYAAQTRRWVCMKQSSI